MDLAQKFITEVSLDMKMSARQLKEQSLLEASGCNNADLHPRLCPQQCIVYAFRELLHWVA